MCLVRVPLDVEDALSSYRRAFERGRRSLLVFQRSHSLLLRLLADTQPCGLSTDGANADSAELTLSLSPGFAAQPHPLKFSLGHNDSPEMQPGVSDEDGSNPCAAYKLPVSPEHMSTVTDAYAASIRKHSKVKVAIDSE